MSQCRVSDSFNLFCYSFFSHRGRKTSLEGNVYTLTQGGKQEPILLFEDGRIARCSSPNDSLSPAHNKHILWADIIQHDEKTNMVCEVVKGSAGCEAMVYRVKNDTQLIQPELIRLQGKIVSLDP